MKEESRLPKGWQWEKLEELLTKKPQYGLTAKSTTKKIGALYIRVTDVTATGQLNLSDPHYVKIDQKTFEKYALRINDVLIARSGATAGKAHIHKEKREAVFASYLIRFQPNEKKIMPIFLFYFFHSPLYWQQIQNWKVGGAQPNVNAKNLVKLTIPLPPLEEQCRIVKHIEQLLGKVEEARMLRRQARGEAEQIMQAALHKVFSRAEEEGWAWLGLKEICTINPSKSEAKNLSDDAKVTFVPMGAVSEVTGAIENPEVRLLSEVKKGYTYFKEGDVLFAKITPCMENGKSAIARSLINKIGFGSTEFHVLRPTQKTISEWVYYFIRQKSFREEAERNMTGSVGQQRVPVDFLKKVKIPLPLVEEQKRRVAYLNKIRETVGSLKKLQQKTEEELEKLAPAILNKAFQGKLS